MRHEGLLRFGAAVLLGGALALPAAAGEAALTLQGNATYHALQIPLWVQTQTRAADLSDIRVLNARDEALSYAWVGGAVDTASREEQQALPFFRAPTSAASAPDASQQGGWILDARAVKGALLTLELSVSPDANGVYGFAIESSDDLQQWQTVSAASHLASLQGQGQRLANSDFDLRGRRAQYLRLRPLPGHAPPPLTGAKVSSVTDYTRAAAMQWSAELSPTHCTPEHCDYSVPPHLPLERLSLQLAEVNTLAAVEVLGQYDPQASGGNPRPAWHRHRVRDHLKGVHRRSDPAETTPAWVPLLQVTAYRLAQPEGEVSASSWALPGDLIRQVRIRPTGGMAQLGVKPPTLRVGAQAPALVFLAREPAPYRLAWGSDAVAGAALPLGKLMPTRRPGDLLPTYTASVVAEAAPPPASALPSAAVTAPTRKFWLWGVLLAALALLGFMAMTLLKSPARP